MGGLIVSGSEWEISKQSSNPNWVCYILFHANILEKGINQFCISSYGLNSRVLQPWLATSLGEQLNLKSIGRLASKLYLVKNILVRETTAVIHNMLKLWPYTAIGAYGVREKGYLKNNSWFGKIKMMKLLLKITFNSLNKGKKEKKNFVKISCSYLNHHFLHHFILTNFFQFLLILRINESETSYLHYLQLDPFSPVSSCFGCCTYGLIWINFRKMFLTKLLIHRDQLL